jgi:hypothetical protein
VCNGKTTKHALIPSKPEPETPVDVSIYTQQDLSKSLKVKSGMSSAELTDVMSARS